jgi:hypothetical protein
MSMGLERLFSPSIFDIVFPFFAFFLVIILPSVFAIFVVVKVLRGDYSAKDNRR